MFLFIRFLKWKGALLSILNSPMVDEFIQRLSKMGMSTGGGCQGAGRSRGPGIPSQGRGLKHSSLQLEKARRDVHSEACPAPRHTLLGEEGKLDAALAAL